MTNFSGGVLIFIGVFAVCVFIGLIAGYILIDGHFKDYKIYVGDEVYCCNNASVNDNVLTLTDCILRDREIRNPANYEIVEKK